jgi:GTP cyclohydrolase II
MAENSSCSLCESPQERDNNPPSPAATAPAIVNVSTATTFPSAYRQSIINSPILQQQRKLSNAVIGKSNNNEKDSPTTNNAEKTLNEASTADIIESKDEEKSFYPLPDNPSDWLHNSNAELGVILADKNQRITHVNPIFELITGYSKSESIGRNCNFLQGKFTDSITVQTIRDSITHHSTCQVAILNYRKNGQAFWNLLTIAPMMNSAGEVTNYVGIQMCQSVIYIDKPMPIFPWTTQTLTSFGNNNNDDTNNAAVDELEEGMAFVQIHKHSAKTQSLRYSSSADSINLLKNGQNFANKIEELPDTIDEINSSTPIANKRVLHKIPKEITQASAVNPSDEHSLGLPLLNSSHATKLSDNVAAVRAVKPSLLAASPVQFVAETLLPTAFGKYRVRAYKDCSKRGLRENREILVIIHGKVEYGEKIALRVHDQCFTSEVLSSLKCDCKDQLDYAMQFIQNNAEKRGIIIYLPQEGRGIGLANKIKAYEIQEHGYDTVDANRLLGFPDDTREYTSVPSILNDLNMKSVQLMTNNPRKIELLCSLGVNILGRIPVIMESNQYSNDYILAKRARMSHLHEHSDKP